GKRPGSGAPGAAAGGSGSRAADDASVGVPAATVPAPRHPYRPGVRVLHRQWGEGEVMSEDDGKLTVLFSTVGYRTLSLSVVTENNLLSTVSDSR
ncbi:ATP-dependent DNA helicase RecQ, partial [Streptomyces sp. DvalAA-14]